MAPIAIFAPEWLLFIETIIGCFTNSTPLAPLIMPEPLHLLLVEDNPKDAELILHTLRRAGFLPDCKRVETEADYAENLHVGLDLILANQKLPQFNGLRALELLKRSGLDIPFILLSAVAGEETAVAAMQQGATDYLLKDRLARLGPAVSHALEESNLRNERRKAEEALRESEERCQRAQRMESIGALTSGIAHDLNNILSPIMMAVDMLKRSSTNDPQTLEVLETIEANARRGSETVCQMLSFGRGLEGERTEVQPRHLLNAIEGVIKDTFPKDIRLRIALEPDPWLILGYPAQLHQIVLNLCLNARDSMPNGGLVTIQVENRMLDEQYVATTPEAMEVQPGPHVALTVTDSGVGIPQADLERIFDPFFSTKVLGKGGGLGLSTVWAIVKAHGGFVTVDSEPGKGTSFRLYLPAKPNSPSAVEQPKPVALPRGEGETVLLIDDEASVLSITSQTLEEFGYQVLSANNGAEAVAIYAQRKDEIAVVLTDLMMPVMNGNATIHALLKINPSVKVIVASGLNANDNRIQAADSGINHFLAKPYTARALLEKLRTALE